MNKKGFTLVELITTFALSTLLITILINVFLIIKNIYYESDLKTKLLIEQGNLSDIMNSKINKDHLISYSRCNDSSFCYDFVFDDGTDTKLIITSLYIKFGDYVYNLGNGSKVVNPTIIKENVELSDISANNSFLVITIPIKNDKYPNQDFGIKLVYQYNSNITSL